MIEFAVSSALVIAVAGAGFLYYARLVAKRREEALQKARVKARQRRQ